MSSPSQSQEATEATVAMPAAFTFSTKKHNLRCFFVEFDKNPSTIKHQKNSFHSNAIYKTHSTTMTTATHN